MDTIPANKAFTISLNIQGMETGNFVNAATNYFSAPQQLNAQGQIIGHTHVVIEQMTSLTQTTPTDATKFAFFKGLNAKAANGVLTADVTAGLGPGVFRLSTMCVASVSFFVASLLIDCSSQQHRRQPPACGPPRRAARCF